jgi:hypothetical protein
VASLVAPLLALMAWFAMDYLFSDPPEPAVEGRSYPLVEKPDCRWESGKCGLKNADFELEMRIEEMPGGRVTLMLASEFPLDGVKAALAAEQDEQPMPVSMQARDAAGLLWSVELARPRPDTDRLYIVASSHGSLYFGDASTRFSADPPGS